MLVRQIEMANSDLSADRVRVSAHVQATAPSDFDAQLWIDLPGELEEFVSLSGDPWLVAVAPLACMLGEPLQIDAPVDPRLLGNVRELLHVWRAFEPSWQIVPMEASAARTTARRGDRCAAFFSGGVDSFFTVLRSNHPELPRPAGRIDDLVSAWGFDIPLDAPNSWDQMNKALRTSAEELGHDHVSVATNLRATTWDRIPWQRVGHGAAMGAVAHALAPRWREIRFAGTLDYAHLEVCGTHPMIDHLLSSEYLDFVHDGAYATRLEKSALIAESPTARRHLHVCWVLANHENCGRCSKCVRTRVMLDALGVLEQFETFPLGTSAAADLHRIDWLAPWDEAYLNEIRACASERGRGDLVVAVDQALARAERTKRRLSRLEAAERTHLLGASARWMKRSLKARLVT